MYIIRCITIMKEVSFTKTKIRAREMERMCFKIQSRCQEGCTEQKAKDGH
jgi:hypothetical protein